MDGCDTCSGLDEKLLGFGKLALSFHSRDSSWHACASLMSPGMCANTLHRSKTSDQSVLWWRAQALDKCFACAMSNLRCMSRYHLLVQHAAIPWELAWPGQHATNPVRTVSQRCLYMPGLSLLWVPRKVLQRPEARPKAGACVANFVSLALCVPSTAVIAEQSSMMHA